MEFDSENANFLIFSKKYATVINRYLITQIAIYQVPKTHFNIPLWSCSIISSDPGYLPSIPGGGTWVFRGAHTFVIKIKKYP